jgi:hypothetical protein
VSHNWTKGDLAAALKTMVVAARDLLPSDVIIDDYGPWQVAKVIYLLDGQVDVRIVIRNALRSNS